MEINDVGFDGRVPRETGHRTERVARDARGGPNAAAESHESASGVKQDTAARMLERLSDQAGEIPPRNIHVLAASVQKFLLTNLEPALRIAKEIRDEASENSEHVVEEMVREGRREQALALLSAND